MSRLSWSFYIGKFNIGKYTYVTHHTTDGEVIINEYKVISETEVT